MYPAPNTNTDASSHGRSCSATAEEIITKTVRKVLSTPAIRVSIWNTTLIKLDDLFCAECSAADLLAPGHRVVLILSRRRGDVIDGGTGA